MAAHVADLAAAEVPIHVPLQAIHAGAAGEVFGIPRMRRRRAEPEVPVEVVGRVARGGQVAWLAKLPVAPGADFLQLADRAVLNEFADAVEVLIFVALSADLGGQLGLVLEVVGADHAGFLHAIGEGFLTIDMLAAIHAPIGNKSVRMVGGAADHRIAVLLVEAFPPVHVLLRPGELLRPKGEVLFVYVADRDDVLAGKTVEMGFGPAPRAEEGDVQLVAGSIGAEEFGPDRRFFSFTSQIATTFSLARPSKWASARPHVPRRAMFNLLLGASAPKSLVRGRMSPAAPVKAMDRRN